MKISVVESFVEEQQVQNNGRFRLSSGRAALQKPILVISHQCGAAAHELQAGIYRQFAVYLPYSYYNPGRIGLKVFDIGRLSLDLVYPNEQNAELVDISS
ncbi:unnamed protein product [Gongylonema pulchrum]|uniref:Uncharacterized protein n=1 Tax=Gongylonema pulchrum TaxID=637853 RepID=A0A3P6SZ64_9BILA|nr:unnamed protein product [Gongylonema pulchrum]